ncbi:MAG: mechanosensitive ion channel family protein [Candidatus Omnitrophota bacterium]
MIEVIIEQEFLNNRVLDYLICISIIIAGFILVKILQHVILRRLKKWAEKTTTTLDDFLVRIAQRIGLPLAYFGVIYLSVNTLTMDPLLKKIIDIAIMAVLTVSAARLAVAVMGHGFTFYWETKGKDVSAERSLKGILKVIKIVVWGIAITFFLDNLGFKISAVIAGLGIGGIAVALAAQAILGDLFSYFAILFDKPFEVGDFIIIGDYLGTIEHIGIKTTRVRSLGGEQLVFSNTDLTSSRLRNYKRMGKRRVVFKLGVTYQTSLEKLKAIPGIIEKVIKNVKDTTFDRAHFASYGDFNLVIEIVYYVMSRDYNKYMDIQQEINFGIKKEFESRGIEFAYPTQTLYVEKPA